jgi:hypothetical protein
MINRDKTEATIYFDDGRSFNLYHSGGLVLDLVAYFTSPMQTSKDITWNGLTTSMEDTAIINLENVS